PRGSANPLRSCVAVPWLNRSSGHSWISASPWLSSGLDRLRPPPRRKRHAGLRVLLGWAEPPCIAAVGDRRRRLGAGESPRCPRPASFQTPRPPASSLPGYEPSPPRWLARAVPQLGQLPRVPFPTEDRPDDGQPRRPAQVTDRIGQLHLHGRQ